MNRRGFLNLLGGALVIVPIAAKISAAPAPKKFATAYETAANALGRGEVSHFMGFRYVETGRRYGKTFAAQAEIDWNELATYFMPGDSVLHDGEKWVCVSPKRVAKVKAKRPRVRPQFACL